MGRKKKQGNEKQENTGTDNSTQGADSPKEAVSDAQEQNESPRDSSGNHIEVQGNPIREAGNRYLLMVPDKKPKELTNFVMRPVNAIKGESTHLTDIEFMMDNGVSFTERMDSSAFVSVQKFKTAIKRFGGTEMRYGGNEQDLDNIQKFMNNKYRVFNHCIGLSCMGLHNIAGEWIYLGTDGAIDRKGKPINNVTSIIEDNKALESRLVDIEMISRSELMDLAPDLFRFNTYERTVSIIGWVCACFLKERLRHRRVKLSHMVIAGTAGSGKSETVEKIIQPIFSLTGTGIGCKGLTNFSVLKSTSSTNTLPIIFEEYKPYKLSALETNLISSMLRSTYDGQTSQRGRADQSVVNYARRSPILVVGESSFDEPAVKERIIDIQFAKSDRTDAHTGAYKSLASKESVLNKLGKALLLFAMNIPDTVLDALIAKSKRFENTAFESRIILGMSNVYLGLLLLMDLFDSYHIDFWKTTGLSDEMIIQAISGNTQNAMDGGEKAKDAVDLIIQVFDTMAAKGRIRKDYEYIVDERCNELCLRTKLIYDEFTKYVREFNITDVEVLASGQFTRQLRKEKYFKGYDLRNFKDRIGDKDEQVRKRCFVLDLDKINQVCELEIFRREDPGYDVDEQGFIKLDENSQAELPFE